MARLRESIGLMNDSAKWKLMKAAQFKADKLKALQIKAVQINAERVKAKEQAAVPAPEPDSADVPGGE